MDQQDQKYLYLILDIYIGDLVRNKIKDIRATRDTLGKALDAIKKKEENFYGTPNPKSASSEDKEQLDFLNRFHLRFAHGRHHEFLIKALVISLYSSFEFISSQISDSLSTAHKEKTALKKMPKNLKGITRIKEYLSQYRSFEFCDEDWKSIESLTLVRNILVHADGFIANEFASKSKKIEAPGITLNGSHIDINPIYLDHIIPITEKVLKKCTSILKR